MKLLSKLTLLALAVSALPLAIAGYSSWRIGRDALRGALEENELTVAKQVASYAGSYIDNLLSTAGGYGEPVYRSGPFVSLGDDRLPE